MCAHRLAIFFYSQAGISRWSAKRKGRNNTGYGSSCLAPALSGDPQVPVVSQQTIWLGPAAAAVWTVLFSSYQGPPDRCSGILSTGPRSLLFLSHLRGFRPFHTKGMSDDASSLSSSNPPTFYAFYAVLCNLQRKNIGSPPVERQATLY